MRLPISCDPIGTAFATFYGHRAPFVPVKDPRRDFSRYPEEGLFVHGWHFDEAQVLRSLFRYTTANLTKHHVSLLQRGIVHSIGRSEANRLQEFLETVLRNMRGEEHSSVG